MTSLVVCGGAHTIWDDLDALSGLRGAHWLPNTLTGGGCAVMAVNDIGMYLPFHVEHWYSNHGKNLKAWQAVRELHFSPAKRLHTTARAASNAGLDVERWDTPSSGSSGLCACWVADALGYSEIVLCGVPLDNGPHFFDRRSTNFEYQGNDTVLAQLARELGSKLRSLSGRTRDAFGPPDRRG